MPVGKQDGVRKNHTVLVIVLAALCGCVLMCGGIGTALLLPAIQSAREAQRRQEVTENLQQIGRALQNYHQVHSEGAAEEPTAEPVQDPAESP